MYLFCIFADDFDITSGWSNIIFLMALKFKLSSQLQRDGLLVLSQCVKKGKTVFLACVISNL